MARHCWVMLLLLTGIPVASCVEDTSPPVQEPVGVQLPGQNATLLQWVQSLEDVYDRRGLTAFLEAKARLMQPGKDWSEDKDYGIVGLAWLNEEVLSRESGDVVSKEKGLAIRLRTLVGEIEQHPGTYGDAWGKFCSGLISYSFGNSPIVRGTAAERLVTLYAKIARCEEQWRKELSETSISAEEAVEKGHASP